MVNTDDLQELRRISTNTYDSDKAFINKLIGKINNMIQVIDALKSEVANLKK